MQVAAHELTRLAQESDTIVVRNTQAGITVYHDELSKITTEWAGAGDASGGDIREMSSTALRNSDFRKAVLTDILVIESAPEAMQQAILAQRTEWDNRQQQKADSVATLERTADKVVSRGATCIAPKGDELCGVIALVKPDVPPLCPEHMNLASRFVSSESGRVVGGKPEIIWKPKSVTRRG